MVAQHIALWFLCATIFRPQVAVPLTLAGDCLQEVCLLPHGATLFLVMLFTQVQQAVYGHAALWRGFRSPPLIRVVSGEDGYLSPAQGPVLYINLEDFVSRSRGQRNEEFMVCNETGKHGEFSDVAPRLSCGCCGVRPAVVACTGAKQGGSHLHPALTEHRSTPTPGATLAARCRYGLQTQRVLLCIKHGPAGAGPKGQICIRIRCMAVAGDARQCGGAAVVMLHCSGI